MKFGKRQIFVLVLTLVVCVAVYVNWKIAKNSTTTEINNITSGQEKTLGEAKFVDNQTEQVSTSSGSEYFVTARLNKKKTRDDSIALLKSISESEKNDLESKKKALDDLRKIALAVEKEDRIESLIKSKGFSESVVFIGDKNVNIVVKSSGLKANEAAQIKDIAVNESGVTPDKVIIIDIK